MNGKMKILMVGVLDGPVCGELSCNLKVLEILVEQGGEVWGVSTVVSADAVSPGSFSFLKMIRGLFCLVKIFLLVPRVDCVYTTPGLSKLGVAKFMPIICWAYIFRKKIVMHYHGSRLRSTYEDSNFLFKFLMRNTFGLADRHIYLSRTMFSDYRDIYKVNDYVVIPNFVDREIVERRICEEPERSSEIFNVVYMSSIMPEKGVFKLIDAFCAAAKDGFDARLTIAGSGSVENISKLRKAISMAPEGVDVIYVGQVSGPSKYELLSMAHCFVLPTEYKQEAMPLAVIEAMAAGAVVITSTAGSLTEVVNNMVNGILMEDCSVETIKNSILRLSSDRKLLTRLSAAGRDVCQVYSETRFASAIINALKF